MRVFLTGGTGYVGSAVLEALVKGGHHVDALVRNSEGASRVQARGATPVLGDVLQPASWRDAAVAADGAVHAAVEYSARQSQFDATAIDTLLSLPPKAGRVLVYTSGIWVLGPAPSPVDETAPLNPIEMAAWRPAHEQRILSAASNGVRAVVVKDEHQSPILDTGRFTSDNLQRMVFSLCEFHRTPCVYDAIALTNNGLGHDAVCCGNQNVLDGARR